MAVAHITFSEEVYSNIWNLLKVGGSENIQLAAGCIMNTEWEGKEFLLHYLSIRFAPTFYGASLSIKVNGWSKFAQSKGFVYGKRHIHTDYTVKLFQYDITEADIKLIKNLTK